MSLYLNSIYRNDQILNHPTVVEMFSFLSLPQGWHFGEGIPIDETTVYEALNIFLIFLNTRFDSKVFPTINGGVNLSLSLKDNFLEIIIEPNKNILLVREKGFGVENRIISENENANYADIQTMTNQIEAECLISELSTPDIITKQNEIFNQMLSKILPTEAEFLSYSEVA